MTEIETKAVKFIQNIKDNAVVTLDHIAKEEPNVSPLLYKGRKEKASTILAMVGELLQYRTIGTVEECREAVEKQTARKVTTNHSWTHYHFFCPVCNMEVNDMKYCPNCGQKIEWSDEE